MFTGFRWSKPRVRLLRIRGVKVEIRSVLFIHLALSVGNGVCASAKGRVGFYVSDLISSPAEVGVWVVVVRLPRIRWTVAHH